MDNQNLTEAEKKFLSETLPEVDERKTLIDKEKQRKKVERLSKHRSIYGWLIIPVIGIPVIGFILFSIGYLQAVSFMGGPATFSWFIQQDITPEMQRNLTEAGFGWLKDFILVMRYRYVILLSVGVVTISLVMLLLWLDNKTIDKKKKELGEILDEEE